MANQGRKPIPPGIRGMRSGAQSDNTEVPASRRANPLVPPRELTVDEQKIWEAIIEPAFWLEQRDILEVYAYVCLSARLVKAKFDVPTALVTVWRQIAANLVLTTAEQVRAGILKGHTHDVNDKFERNENVKIDFFNRVPSLER